MHTHHLHADTHKAFLSEGRIDPITGEKILADDEIVICAACKSAFLRETWEYLGKKHCGQTETAKELPKKSLLSLKKRHLLGEIIYESPLVSVGVSKKLSPIQLFIDRLGTIAFITSFFSFILLFLTQEAIVAYTFLVSFVALITSLITLRSKVTSQKRMSLHTRGIEVSGDTARKRQSYPFTSLESIHLVFGYGENKLDDEFPLARIHLQVYPKLGEPFWVGITDKVMEFRRISRIVFDLHEQVDISFSVNDSGDYKRLTRMAREAGKNIKVNRI
ncbi:MAG: hypothetical protein AAF740_13530 [Bacteroidota bacterium]